MVMVVVVMVMMVVMGKRRRSGHGSGEVRDGCIRAGIYAFD
jgi:hypothetical protein